MSRSNKGSRRGSKNSRSGGRKGSKSSAGSRKSLTRGSGSRRSHGKKSPRRSSRDSRKSLNKNGGAKDSDRSGYFAPGAGARDPSGGQGFYRDPGAITSYDSAPSENEVEVLILDEEEEAEKNEVLDAIAEEYKKEHGKGEGMHEDGIQVEFLKGKFQRITVMGEVSTGCMGRLAYAMNAVPYFALGTFSVAVIGFLISDPEDDFNESSGLSGASVYGMFLLLALAWNTFQMLKDAVWQVDPMGPVTGSYGWRKTLGIPKRSMEPRSMAISTLVEIIAVIYAQLNETILSEYVREFVIGYSAFVFVIRLLFARRIALEYGDGMGSAIGALYVSKAFFVTLLFRNPLVGIPFGIVMTFVGLYGAIDSRPWWDILLLIVDSALTYYVEGVDSETFFVVVVVTALDVIGDFMLFIMCIPPFTGFVNSARKVEYT